jgi:hypothetical protein
MEFVLLILMVLLAAAGPWWGTDSRDGRDWQARCEWEVREEMGRARARTALR